MGLEIAKIQNASLQAVAKEADKNNDGFIAGREELNVFEEAAAKAVKSGLASKRELKETMKMFEIQYPQENEYLKNIAISSDVDESKTLTEKELQKYIDNAKKAEKNDFTTEEEIESTTDGFYQKKSNWQKFGRAALIAGGAIVLGLLGAGARYIKINSMFRKEANAFINELKGLSEYSRYTRNGKLAKVVSDYGRITVKTTDAGVNLVRRNLFGGFVAGGAAGGLLASLIPEKNR